MNFNDGTNFRYYIDDVIYKMIPTQSYEDDFEAYNPGSYLAVSNSLWWATWTNAPGTGEDIRISDTFAHSGSYSGFITWQDGITDALLLLGDKTSGVYELDWKMYIEDGYGAYYNLQHFESPGIEWAFEIYFMPNGTGEFRVGGDSYYFNFPNDAWFSVEHLFNIDEDQATILIDDVEVHTWPFHYETWTTDGTNQLGSVDFNDGVNYRYYIDDIEFDSLDVTGILSKDVLPHENSVSIYPNPATDQITVSSEEEITELEILDQVGKAVFYQNSGKNSLTLNTSAYPSGIYFLRVRSANGMSTKKLIIQ